MARGIAIVSIAVAAGWHAFTLRGREGSFGQQSGETRGYARGRSAVAQGIAEHARTISRRKRCAPARSKCSTIPGANVAVVGLVPERAIVARLATKTTHVLYLASQSPRRRQLLEMAGIHFDTVDVDVPEVRASGEPPRDYVARVAREKAGAGLLKLARASDAVVLGADTEVVLDDEVFGKPSDDGH